MYRKCTEYARRLLHNVGAEVSKVKQVKGVGNDRRTSRVGGVEAPIVPTRGAPDSVLAVPASGARKPVEKAAPRSTQRKAAATKPAPSPRQAAATRGKPAGVRGAQPKAVKKGRSARTVVVPRAAAKERGGAPSRKPVPRRAAASKSRSARVLPMSTPRGAATKKGAGRSKHLEQREPDRVVRVRALDPFQRCGPRTSVVHLVRVDERLDGESSVHLVFFDRHGWYCEHGKACRAVDDVRLHGKQLGLTF